ncbi:hypothetical protein Nepgr_022817 [Nepenthes gracilis]|uniref:DYW domain-containing protein n=1 Tax=Nepenthes gracilis TaxID=150966 RepID=A0AAD3T061_NEPGR|nr:hypothetical protein Nepgr_022817 [Nepenthes gracilis]
MSWAQPQSPPCLPIPTATAALPPLQTQKQHTTPHLQRSTLQLPTTGTSTVSPSKPTSHVRSKASWVESLRHHTRSNLFHEAVSTYIEMTMAEIAPENFAFPAVFKAVAGLKDLNLGKQVHGHVIKFGYVSEVSIVDNSLVNLYGKCGDIGDVYKVFDRIPERDLVSWNSMIAALCQSEEWELALEALSLMQMEGFEPSSFTLVSAALACSNLSLRDGWRLGRQVHGYSLRRGDAKTFTINALMAMYAKLRKLDYAEALLEVFDNRDLVTWNTMISSFSQNDYFLEALTFLKRMILEGVKPDGVTIASVLPACSHLELLNLGKEIHAFVMRNEDFSKNSFVASALVDMYCNCKQVDSGRRVFDSVVGKKIALWNAMITGYTQNGHDEEALILYTEMVSVAGILPNPTTMASVLPACIHSEDFSDREGIHGFVVKLGFEKHLYVQNALMDMYARMGKIEISKAIFDSMEFRDRVSWNTLITGYVVCGRCSDALLMLHDMQRSSLNNVDDNDNQSDIKILCKANSITLMAILPGCAALSALAKGKEIHAYAIRNALASDVAVGSALVDMYAKCGCLHLSRRAFDEIPNKNVITWNVLIMAYGMHGHGEEAFKLFRMMAAAGARGNVKPNEVTFIAVLAACSHSGMVHEGLGLFYKMKEHEIEPTSDHYACIIDLLGRAGRLEDAYQLLDDMPPEINKAGAWSSMLGACRIHKNVLLGEIAARNLFQLEPHVASHYVLLSNIFSSAGLWDKAMEIRKNMREMGVRKEPGCSWIEFGDRVHRFMAGDASHPQSEQLYAFLEDLSDRMRKEGYVPDTSCVLHDVDKEEKENLLCGHSEKLAIAFGILNTRPGTIIRVAKNLRVCNDCHVATKFISKILEREIILRDVRRFHHFKDGTCSCGDYW